MTAETLEFRTELKQVMEIIIHSLYSNKEIFLRELVSNAADAIDKIRFDAISNADRLEGDLEWRIKVTPDAEANTLTISDNGIGMNRQGLVEDLGTIARSGTQEFLKRLQETDAERRPELIGQFGVGFYSAFMVAERVTVITRMAGETQGCKWTSNGQGSFTVEECDKEGRGTDVILHLKEDEKDFTGEWRLKSLVKKFSDFIEHPVILVGPKRDKEGKEIPGETEEETLNTQQAIWVRAKDEIKKDEYTEFYKHISHDFEEPFETVHFTAEGTMEFKALLFIPKKKPFDFAWRDKPTGLQLYVKRVFIMDECDKLIPRWLGFVKGVVDSSDLPLNVSREMIQEDKTLVRIRKAIVNKVLGVLKEMREKEYDRFVQFWQEFGPILKAGVTEDFENKDKLAELLLFASTARVEGRYVSLDQYVEAMPEEQEEIFYMVGETREMVENSPYMEHFKEKGREVLIMTDPVDEWVASHLGQYKEKKLKAIDKGEIEGDEEVAKDKAKPFKGLLKFLGPKLKSVKEVRLSARLKESAACLVGAEGGMGAGMERLMKEMGHAVPDQDRYLELNPDHPAVQAMLTLYEANPKDERVSDLGRVFYDQALIAAGGKLTDPAAYAARVNSLLVKGVGN